MTDDVDRLSLGAAHPGSQGLKLRVPPIYADELCSLLAAEGLETVEGIELSAGARDLVFEIVGALGSTAGVVAAVQGFLNRHRDRVFRVRFGGQEYEVKGCSPKQAEEFVAQAVRQAEEYDARWKEMRE